MDKQKKKKKKEKKTEEVFPMQVGFTSILH